MKNTLLLIGLCLFIISCKNGDPTKGPPQVDEPVKENLSLLASGKTELPNGDKVKFDMMRDASENDTLKFVEFVGDFLGGNYKQCSFTFNTYAVEDSTKKLKEYFVIEVLNPCENVATKFVQFPQHPITYGCNGKEKEAVGVLNVTFLDENMDDILDFEETPNKGNKVYSVNIPAKNMPQDSSIFLFVNFPQGPFHVHGGQNHKVGIGAHWPGGG